VRIAGISVGSDDGGFRAHASERIDPAAWNGDVALLLTHFPVHSTAQRVTTAGLKYAGDLVNIDEVAGPLVARTAPTIVVHGHLHVRDAFWDGMLLQMPGPDRAAP
jgi:hypothetical protein